MIKETCACGATFEATGTFENVRAKEWRVDHIHEPKINVVNETNPVTFNVVYDKWTKKWNDIDDAIKQGTKRRKAQDTDDPSHMNGPYAVPPIGTPVWWNNAWWVSQSHPTGPFHCLTGDPEPGELAPWWDDMDGAMVALNPLGLEREQAANAAVNYDEGWHKGYKVGRKDASYDVAAISNYAITSYASVIPARQGIWKDEAVAAARGKGG